MKSSASTEAFYSMATGKRRRRRRSGGGGGGGCGVASTTDLTVQWLNPAETQVKTKWPTSFNSTDDGCEGGRAMDARAIGVGVAQEAEEGRQGRSEEEARTDPKSKACNYAALLFSWINCVSAYHCWC